MVFGVVQGYMPAYEIYLDRLRAGFFSSTLEATRMQLHVLLDRSRNIAGLKLV